jgi:hypothetical protein
MRLTPPFPAAFLSVISALALALRGTNQNAFAYVVPEPVSEYSTAICSGIQYTVARSFGEESRPHW